MAHIQRRGSKRIVRWKDLDGREKSRSFETAREARDFRSKIESSLAQGTYVDPGAGKITLKEHANNWLLMSQASDATKAKYRSLLDVQILPALGSIPLAKLTPVHVQQFIAGLTDLKPATVWAISSVLSSLSHAAVDYDILPKGFMPRRVGLPRQHADERVFLNPKQIQDLVAKHPPLYQALVHTAAFTGLRWGELAGLKVNRVNLPQRRLEVVETLNYTGGSHFEPPKTSASRRSIGITRTTADILAEHIEQFGLGEHDVVFHGERGGMLNDNNFRKRIWKPSVAKAKSVPDRTRFHDLRHTACALMISLGMHPKAIQKRLGHASVTITMDRYGHLFDDMEERDLEALDQLAK